MSAVPCGPLAPYGPTLHVLKPNRWSAEDTLPVRPEISVGWVGASAAYGPLHASGTEPDPSHAVGRAYDLHGRTKPTGAV